MLQFNLQEYTTNLKSNILQIYNTQSVVSAKNIHHTTFSTQQYKQDKAVSTRYVQGPVEGRLAAKSTVEGGPSIPADNASNLNKHTRDSAPSTACVSSIQGKAR